MAKILIELPAPVPPDKWGHDHYSTLLYVETCCVDRQISDGSGVGLIHNLKMRCNAKVHPSLAHLGSNFPPPTRLKDGVQLELHDDWSCLEDMEVAGFVQVVDPRQGYVRLHEKGIALAHALRAHKIRGGSIDGFSPDEKLGELLKRSGEEA